MVEWSIFANRKSYAEISKPGVGEGRRPTYEAKSGSPVRATGNNWEQNREQQAHWSQRPWTSRG